MNISNFHKPATRFLSNFYPIQIQLDDVEYPSVEHAYQAAKTLDKGARAQIAACGSPGEAKRLGRKLKIREDWEEVKIPIMQQLLEQKFLWHKDLEALLQKTRDAQIIEGNYWHDNFWGSCTCNKCGDKGQNVLGKMLMDIRACL